MRAMRHAWSRERPYPTTMAGGEIGPAAEIWERRRSLKLLRAIAATDGAESHPARVIEIDHIVASVSEWRRCTERRQDGWDVTELSHGLILAERTIG